MEIFPQHTLFNNLKMNSFSEKMKSFVLDFKVKYNNSLYNYLILDFLHSYRNKTYWDLKIFPLLEKLKNEESFIVDWDSFDWEGKVCFRKNYIILLDKSIFKSDRKFPPMLDENNNPIIDGGGQWLENTNFIEENYTEYFKIPLDEFFEICERWYKEVLID